MISKKFAKFITSGVCAAATEYVAFVILDNILNGQFLVICQSASFLFGFIVSFSLNRSWVFNSYGKKINELIKYSILAAVNLVLSNIIIWFIVFVLNVSPWYAKIATMILIASWNYIIFQRIIFTNKKSTDQM